MTKILEIEILEWFKKESQPNEDRKYFRCPVCDLTWWGDDRLFGKERHTFFCWIPRLQNSPLPDKKEVKE